MSVLRDAWDADKLGLLPPGIFIDALGDLTSDSAGTLHADHACGRRWWQKRPGGVLTDPRKACSCIERRLRCSGPLMELLAGVEGRLALPRSLEALARALPAPVTSPREAHALVMLWGEVRTSEQRLSALASLPGPAPAGEVSGRDRSLLERCHLLLEETDQVFSREDFRELYASSLQERHYSREDTTPGVSVIALEQALVSPQEVEASAVLRVFSPRGYPDRLVVPAAASMAVVSRLVHSSANRHVALLGEVSPEVLEIFLALWDPGNEDGPFASWASAQEAAQSALDPG